MESNRTVLLLLMAMVLCSLTSAVLCEGASLSGKKNLEMKRLLRSLNKPAVKSIKTNNGDIFDCVDINKQPAFDHPLLTNHTVQMRPSSHPTRKVNSTCAKVEAVSVRFPKEGCPLGTVPIRRVKMRELRGHMSLTNFGKESLQNSSYSTSDAQYIVDLYVAGVRTSGTFYGAKTAMNVWEPYVGDHDKTSYSRVKITSRTYERLEAGWMVSSALFGDYRSRLFISWQNTNKVVVYNTFAPGFVQTSSNVALGAELSPVSVVGGKQYEFHVLVYLDRVQGNWWFKCGDEFIGYWPKELFHSLSDQAYGIHWGGVVRNEDGTGSPQMGSGYYAESGFRKACFMRAMEVVIDGNTIVDPPQTSVEPALPCFTVNDMGDYGSWGKSFFFGGPGGPCPRPSLTHG